MKKMPNRKVSLVYVLCIYLIAGAVAFGTVLVLPPEMSPLMKGLLGDFAAMIIVFLFSFLTGNSSVYDPYWSVVPPLLYAYWITALPGVRNNPWTWLFFIAVCLWSLRLTVNWAVNWKGFIHEDWRYVGFRKTFRKIYWLVSFFGIHLFPTIMVFGVSIPIYTALSQLHHGAETGWFFALTGIIIMLVGTILEFTADLQMYRFKKSQEDNAVIFDKGLWSFSRHPNYLGEILFWFGAGIFALTTTMDNYKLLVFPIAMLLMFVFYSIPAMEKKVLITRPEYAERQKEISSLLLLPKGRVLKCGKPLAQRKYDIENVDK